MDDNVIEFPNKKLVHFQIHPVIFAVVCEDRNPRVNVTNKLEELTCMACYEELRRRALADKARRESPEGKKEEFWHGMIWLGAIILIAILVSKL